MIGARLRGAACGAAFLCACAAYSPSRVPTSDASEVLPPSPALRAELPRARPRDLVIDDRDGLSPDEAAILAVDHNPSLRAARAQRGIASAEIIAAGLLPNPRLNAAVEVPFAGEGQHVLGFGGEIAWNVSPLLARGPGIEAAEEAAKSVDLEIAWQEWQVAQAARLHAIRVIYSARRLAAAREIEAAAQERLAALQAVLQQGAVTALEVTGAENSLAEAGLARLDLEQAIARARVDLNAALGVDPQAELPTDSAWTAPRDLPPLDTLLRDLPERRLDLIALKHAHSSHDQRLRAAILAQFPPVEIGVTAGRDVEAVTAAGVTLSFELPFLDRNQAKVAQSRAQRSEVEAEYAARLAEARAQTVGCARELDVVVRKLSTAAAAADSAARLAKLADEAASAGGITPLAAAEIDQRAWAAQLRQLEIEQSLAELWLALATASGSTAEPAPPHMAPGN